VKLGYNEQTFKHQGFEPSPQKISDYAVGNSYTSKPYDRFDDCKFKTAYVNLTSEFSLASMDHQVLFGMNCLDYYYRQLKTNVDSVDFLPWEALMMFFN
jgi:iron complex outermembrane receptor protein